MNYITKSNANVTFILIFAFLTTQAMCYNVSICDQFNLNGVYYTINANYDNQNQMENNLIYNFCNQIEQYCNASYQVVTGSMVKFYGADGCYPYMQTNV